MALELRPNCEGCDQDLLPDDERAMICSYECTFCRDCVERLRNTCPNCGGGFTPRPVRPSNEWRLGLSLTLRPASTLRVGMSYTWAEADAFAASLAHIAPRSR
jgi:uncharacterized protein